MNLLSLIIANDLIIPSYNECVYFVKTAQKVLGLFIKLQNYIENVIL
jgi:hypothetical protein